MLYKPWELTVRAAVSVFTTNGWVASQVRRVSATYSFWQHLTGHVTSSQWAVLHDGAGSHSRTAEALPLKANLQIGV